MFQVELGPYGGDKVNILKAGGDYGWPDYSYGRQNDSSPLPDPHVPGIEQALLVWLPGITPSGIMFYTGDKFPAWKNNMFVGSTIRGRVNGASGVERVVFNDKDVGNPPRNDLARAETAHQGRSAGSGRLDLRADRRGRWSRAAGRARKLVPRGGFPVA